MKSIVWVDRLGCRSGYLVMIMMMMRFLHHRLESVNNALYCSRNFSRHFNWQQSQSNSLPDHRHSNDAYKIICIDKLLRCRHNWDKSGISLPLSIHYGKMVKNIFVFPSSYREWRWIVWKSRWHVCLRAARRTWLFPGLRVWRACGSWTLTPGWSGQIQMLCFSIRNWGRRGCSCRWGQSSDMQLKIPGCVFTIVTFVSL